MSTQLLEPRTRPEQTSPPKRGPSRRPTWILVAVIGAIAAMVVTSLLVSGDSEPQETFSPERVRTQNILPPSGEPQSLDGARERSMRAYTDRLNGLAEHYGSTGEESAIPEGSYRASDSQLAELARRNGSAAVGAGPAEWSVDASQPQSTSTSHVGPWHGGPQESP